jgi:predicted N-acetyltransferase YhbS
MKQSFTENRDLSDDLFDLLDIVFPGIRNAAEHARALGAAWEDVSTPFVFVQDGHVRSHVGVIELPLVLVGRTVKVGSVHAVATHPEHRRLGHCRRLMEELLRDCEGRYETLILTTERPEYCEPYGFRVVQEHCFTVECDAMQHHSEGRPDRLRLLDMRDARDVALVRRLLETREPVSRVVGVASETVVFFFNEGRNPLWYAEDLDVVVCLEQRGRTLTLFDVVGPHAPPLDALVERISHPVDEVLVCFAPDLLRVDGTARPHVLDHDGPSYLMVHGPFGAENQAFTLPRSART